MAIIQDAATGRTARVDDENRLNTFSVAQLEDKHTNIEGRYDSIFFEVTPAGADDYFFYLKNIGNEDISVTDIRVSSSVPSNILLDHVTGTPTYVTGTEAEITNRNLGSNKLPDVDAQFDTDITVITKVGTLLFQECNVANELYHFKPTSTIIIPQGQAVALKRVAATGDITCLVSVSLAES